MIDKLNGFQKKTYKRNLKSAFNYFKRFVRTRCNECFIFCLQDLGLIEQ